MLTFDLKNGTCREEISGESYPAQAIMRNGIPYLPVVMVCNFFGLDFSYTAFSPVSYTHLDVYKRQGLGLSKM